MKSFAALILLLLAFNVAQAFRVSTGTQTSTSQSFGGCGAHANKLTCGYASNGACKWGANKSTGVVKCWTASAVA